MQRSAAATARPPAKVAKHSKLTSAPLSGLLGFPLRLVQNAVQRDFNARMAELGLTQSQYAVLELVDANPGAPQVELAATLDTDRASMMTLVDRLEARGLLARAPNLSDRRRQEMRLTPAGRDILSVARRLVSDHEAQVFGSLSEHERDMLKLYLQRLYAAAT